MAERIDSLHLPDYRIIQDDKTFCYGIDAVLLSNFVLKNASFNLSSPNENLQRTAEGESNFSTTKIFDLGTGNAIIPILLAAQSFAPLKITGLEYQEKIWDMANRSVQLNNFSPETCIQIVHGDIKNIPNLFKKSLADIVVSNPPYVKLSCARQSSNTEKMIARQEIFCTLDDVILGAAHLLKENGKFFMIHRPQRLQEIFDSLKKNGFDDVQYQFVCPFKEHKPTMVLVCATFIDKKIYKITKTQLPSLVVYKEKNSKAEYTEEIQKIYSPRIKA
ncbi:tRNA1(Val) (adenine(37)-N6)-methyltransferase [Treponema pectinovorum]|uniref:tRNA1(Val) (adenine(37)-N6)-methyltransferase n=1 Tax=Treponema pectinovorum TaxID=164 RepID=UPI0011F22846|nr:methyltransferase domain-containing protein [Treponema pectinovorum]